MIFRTRQPRRSAIGIDVGARHINAIQMDAAASDRRIVAAIAIPRMEPGKPLTASELRPLPAILRRAGFLGNKIVVSVPLEKQIGGVVEVPRAAASDHIQMARMELARAHRCSPDSFEIACWDLPEAVGQATGTGVMAVACRHEDATPYLDCFEMAGFDVEVLDVRSAALARAVDLVASLDGGVTALVELNWQATLLVLVHRGEVIYERKLADADLQRAYDALVARLQLDAEVADHLILEAGLETLAGDAPVPRQARAILSEYVDGLAAELSASLGYARQRSADQAAVSLVLCGDGATIPGIDRKIGDAVKLPTRKISPSDLCGCAVQYSTAAASPGLITAVGLAL